MQFNDAHVEKLQEQSNTKLSEIKSWLLLIQSWYAIVWISRFYYEDYLDFVKHLMFICLKRFILIVLMDDF